MLTLTYNGTVFSNMTPEALASRGVPSAAIASASQDARRQLISAECRRRIYAVASAETQMNMATAAAVISGLGTSERTPEDETTLDGVRAALGWVNAMRAAVLTLADDPEADFTADAAWPDLPSDVATLVTQF